MTTTSNVCVICEGVIEVEAFSGWDQGYNAYPVAEGRCCKICDDVRVLPARIERLLRRVVKRGS